MVFVSTDSIAGASWAILAEITLAPSASSWIRLARTSLVDFSTFFLAGASATGLVSSTGAVSTAASVAGASSTTLAEITFVPSTSSLMRPERSTFSDFLAFLAFSAFLGAGSATTAASVAGASFCSVSGTILVLSTSS